MLVLALACTLPPESLDDTAGADGADADLWDICWRTATGNASGAYTGAGAPLGGCSGTMSLGCDEYGVRGSADLACDGPVTGLTLDLFGVQSGTELGGEAVIRTEDGEPIRGSWLADVAKDGSIRGGFETAGELVAGEYELFGAFALGLPVDP
jgi:hypothetical protein